MQNDEIRRQIAKESNDLGDASYDRYNLYREPKDLEEAVSHYKKAGDNKHPQAVGILLNIYALPEYSISLEDCVADMKKYLKSGDVFAQLRLGILKVGDLSPMDLYGQKFSDDDLSKIKSHNGEEGICLINAAVNGAEFFCATRGIDSFELLKAEYLYAAQGFHVQVTRLLNQGRTRGDEWDCKRLLKRTEHCYEMGIAWAEKYGAKQLVDTIELLLDPVKKQLAVAE